MEEETEELSAEAIAAADAELGGADAGEAVDGGSTAGGASVSDDDAPQRGRSPSPGDKSVPATRVAAPVEDLDLPEPLQKKFGAAKVSEIWKRAQDGEATKADLRQLFTYAQQLEQQLKERAAPAAPAAAAAVPPEKAEPGEWFLSKEYFEMQQKDPAAFRKKFVAELRAVSEQGRQAEIDKQVQAGVQKGIQPLVQTEQQRQVAEFTSQMGGKFQQLYTRDPRFAPAIGGKAAGELFAAADKFYTENQQWLEQRAWADRNFDPFAFASKQVLGELATLSNAASENKLKEMRARAGAARPTSGANTRPAKASGSVLDDMMEVSAENPELAEGVDQNLMAKMAKYMESKGL